MIDKFKIMQPQNHKRGQSDAQPRMKEYESQKVSMITKDIQPLETPSMGGVSSRYQNRSKTPSGQNSISQSLEFLNDSVSRENRDVRLANKLKNPFRVSH